MRKTTFQLKPVPPFRLDLTVWVLRRRSHNLVDRWDGGTYRRVLVVQDQAVEVAVSQTGPAESPRLLVEAEHTQPQKELTAILTPVLTRMLGVNADLSDFYRLAGADARLGPLMARFRGFKPPRYPSVFEALVNAIAGQQISLTLAIHLLNRLATSYGPVFPGTAEPRRAFPRPRDLANLTPEAFRALGFSRSKGSAIIAVARGLTTGSLDLEDLEKIEEAEAVARLIGLKGVGRWSAEYVLLRGLGHWSVFPGDDVGARRHLEKWLKLAEPLDYEGVRRVLAGWQPYGGLIYFHFLLSGLAEDGHLS
ncbi:MAG: DNA-3-methyladenine glycosylase family protein [Desulfobaccales bacterium]